MNIGLILSSGEGRRFNSSIPKQYCLLNEKEVIEYSIKAMKECTGLDAFIVMCNHCYIEPLQKKYGVMCIEGGATRNESLHKGLEYIKENYGDCRKVFIQEAARPFVTAAIISQYIQLLEKYDAVITTKKITDSLGGTEEWIVDREQYFLVQAPEAFDFGKLYESFKPDSPITATYQQLPVGSKVYCNYDFENNLKITYSNDLKLAELMMKGFD